MSAIPPGGYQVSASSPALSSPGAALSPAVTDPHRPADDTEQVYYDGSPKLRGRLGTLFGMTFLGVLLIVCPILLRYYKDFPSFAIIALCFIVGIILMFVPPLRARTVRYRITNYRIDYERGLLARNIDTMELWHVEDIHFRQSLMDRILNVGTIIVIGHDETMPRLEMDGLPNPRPLYETLKQRVIAVKRSRGVVKMDPG